MVGITTCKLPEGVPQTAQMSVPQTAQMTDQTDETRARTLVLRTVHRKDSTK